jgi:hypothetical protein
MIHDLARFARERMMHPDEPLRLCTTCSVPHYENCGACFGFGVMAKEHPDGPIPIPAGQAADVRNANPKIEWWKPCPECGSTIYGVENAR